MQVYHCFDGGNVTMGGIPSAVGYLHMGLSANNVQCIDFCASKTIVSNGSGYMTSRIGEYLESATQSARSLLMMYSAIRRCEVVHIHGLWSVRNILASLVCQVQGRPVIVSIHGALAAEALRYSPLRKKVFWWIIQKRTLNWAQCIHVTSKQEYADIRHHGIKSSVGLVPNCVFITEKKRSKSSLRNSTRRRRLLYLGRIHPIKGLENLILAWALIERHHPDWTLEIAGPSENGHVNDLKKLSLNLKCRQLQFSGAVTGEEREAIYFSADVTVLPSHSENFGMTVVESLSRGIPVIASEKTPWSSLESEGCGWWVRNDPENLALTLNLVLKKSNIELNKMGELGRTWVSSNFGHQQIGKRMASLYAWALVRNNTDRPPDLL